MFRRVKRVVTVQAVISGNNYKYHWKVHSSRAMFSIIITVECKCHFSAFVNIKLSMQLAVEEEEERKTLNAIDDDFIILLLLLLKWLLMQSW